MSTHINPICQYMGSKKDLADWIIPHFPQHKRYVELFGGTASILLNKPKAGVEVYNDKNKYISNLFEAIVLHYDEFVDRLRKWNLSEIRYDEYFENHDFENMGDVEAALKYFYILKLCGYGKYNGGFYVNQDKANNQLFAEAEKDVKAFHERMKGVLIYNRDYERLIGNYDRPDTIFYADPPYKGTESYYEHIVGKFDTDDHINLCDVLSQIKGTFFVSYEADDFIEELYKDFIILKKKKARPGKRSKEGAVEILITNKEPKGNYLFTTEQMQG